MAQANPPSTSDQSSGSAATPSSSTSSDQNANPGAAAAGAAGTSDQTGANAAGTSDDTAGAAKRSKSGNLPQTASPLPLLGLLGLGSAGLGLLASKKRRS
jgi:LPXTG-motif cell wall-anchored protein